MPETILVAAVPLGPGGTDDRALRREAEAGITAAAAAGARLVVLPELSFLPYVATDAPQRWSGLAESRDGPTGRFMAELARANRLAVLFGLAETDGRGLPVNAALLARPDGTIERAATKRCLPPRQPGDGFGESDHFRAGTDAIAVTRLGPLRLAVLICYDRRFPGHWAQAAAAGADLVAVMVAGPAPQDPPGFFRSELRAHAAGAGLFALSAARYGVESLMGRDIRHDGETLAVARDGKVMAAGDSASPAPIIMSIPVGRAFDAAMPTAIGTSPPTQDLPTNTRPA
ncbi:carbon-nitrogen hydrolase family protein [Bosea sp. 685]|uniref:carbon-nitrogen hydrolase family protein n=1 Tax=Bosea sp. 685 TaxID=3080057 RepID=UPI0028931E5D|nr:carbon-nitrogen hydrolase family protein [Bosea sp. 685]WNJ88621.1 carbon-nitrogen hydrolase family protein [Bosea sp. 685]